MDALEEMISRLKEMNMQKSSTDCLTNQIDVCPKCHGTGLEMYDENGLCYVKECGCGVRQKKIMENNMVFANVPMMYQDARLDNFDKMAYNETESQNKAKTAVECANYWLNNFEALKGRGIGLYLYSRTKGSGKTRMAASIANELIFEKKVQVKFCTSLQILNEIKSTWDKQNDYSESKLLDFLSTSDVLIIDDFGTEQTDKQWINERFYQIINNRYIDKKITIFTSNEKLDLLKYDERITNRIKERVFQIPFPEESVRDLIAKENMREIALGIKKKKEG